ncbi:LysR substrate-binding domain-containing protein [Chelatococcus sp. GCM10030263]|uniref:LysR substrate-binding domain-containing protein n=1 Tax=Chelatococcus sp. GCM10030263 TaxID=3273387 RepID=UPI003613F116
MKRPPTLRQIDAFRALIETGSVSAAADLLRVSQPAVSKSLAHLEEDTELRLFDRVKGRLVPTFLAMRLYEEIDRVFAGLRQVEQAVEALKREQQERLTIGVIPALSDFAPAVVSRFLKARPGVHIVLAVRGSQFVVEWVSNRQVDIGIISGRVEVPYLETETILRDSLVCVLPRDHPLARKRTLTPRDMESAPLITYSKDARTRQLTELLFEEAGAKANVAIETTTAQVLCQCVVEGLGIGVVHPLMARSVRSRVAIRPIVPAITSDFLLCWRKDSRNSALVAQFIEEVHALDRTA